MNQLAESFWLHVLFCLAAGLILDTVASPRAVDGKTREDKVPAFRDWGATIRWTIVAVLIPYILLLVVSAPIHCQVTIWGDLELANHRDQSYDGRIGLVRGMIAITELSVVTGGT